jgi:ribosomal protein S1
MKKRKYSCYDYDLAERETLEALYTNSLPEESGFSWFRGKDLQDNTSVKARISLFNEELGVLIGETSFGQSIVIDIKKEEKSLKKLGYPTLRASVGDHIDVVVTKDVTGSFIGSLSAGYEKALKDELFKAIKNEDCAFSVKVKTVCNGGFMVDLSGIPCFLPGSLAAANRIMNFHDYVGKEINVMVEMYDQKREIFVVSFKKYLSKIIGEKVKDLSFTHNYEGTVTGSSPTGLFVEWDEIFTGIIPFDEKNKEKLESLKQGDTISFYVADIKNPQRITLSHTEPNQKMKNLQELKDNSEEVLGENSEVKIYKGEVTKLKTFGVFVKLENGMTGLIEKENLVYSLNDYEEGQSVNCSVSSVDSSTLKVQLIEVD